MKKITLLSMLFIISVCFNSYAQISEDFETDPPTGWTFMQTEVDDPGFVQTSIRANGGTYSFFHDDDNIAVSSTSWMISPSLNVSIGDVLSFYYNHNFSSFAGEENGIWISTASADPIANPSDFILLYDLLGNASEDTWTEYTQSLDAYDGMTVYLAFKYSGDFEDELFIDDFFAGTPPTDTADFNNLQWPPNGSITTGGNHDVYARIYEAGLTDMTAGQAPGIEAWIGTSSADTDPSTGGWTWSSAAFDSEVGNDDEYLLDIGPGLTAGTYYYASRFRLNGGPYTYGGILADGTAGNFWDGITYVSGVLMVTDPPPPANDDCSGAITVAVGLGSCGADATGTNVSATDSGVAQATCATATYSGGDIWYTFTMPAGETELMYTRSASDFSTTQVELYGDTCGALTEIDCTTSTSITFTGLTPSTTYYLRLYDWGNDDFGDVTFCLGTPPPPPANDVCSGAIALTPGVVFTDNPLTGTNSSTSDSGETDPVCASYSGGDLWYSVVVPPDGNITLEMDSNPTANGGDAGGAVYSGSCGGPLVLIECDDDDGPGLYPLVVISDVGLAGQTIYFRVWEFGNNALINFQVSAYSATLGIGDNKIEGFKLYPNPANDVLNFSAQQSINDVRIYSLLGQEVMRIQPNTIKSQVDISNLSTGMYVVKVQVGDKTGSYRIIKQ